MNADDLATPGPPNEVMLDDEPALSDLHDAASTQARCEVRLQVATRLWRLGRHAEAIPYLEHALEECAGEPPALAEALRLQLGRCLLWTDPSERGARLIRQSARRAGGLADPGVRAYARLARAELHAHSGAGARAAREYEAAAQLALDAGDLYTASSALHWAAAHWLQEGRGDEGIALSHSAVALAERCENRPTLVEAHAVRAVVFLMRGEWDLVEAELKAGARAAEHLSDLPIEAFYLTSVSWQLRLWRADASTLAALEDDVRAAALPHAMFELGRWLVVSKVLVRRGRIEEALEVLQLAERWLTPEPPKLQVDFWRIAAFALLSCLCDASAGDQALQWSRRLEPYADAWVPHTIPAFEFGRAAMQGGRWTEAVRWLSLALERALAMRAAPFAALASCELGLAYSRRKSPGDLSRARRCLEEAHGRFAVLGMVGDEEEARRRLVSLDGDSGGPALTPRQLEIVRLAGRGMSNRDIAAQLVLSEKTVACHLANAFETLGVHNRSAAAWAIGAALRQPRLSNFIYPVRGHDPPFCRLFRGGWEEYARVTSYAARATVLAMASSSEHAAKCLQSVCPSNISVPRVPTFKPHPGFGALPELTNTGRRLFQEAMPTW